MLPEIAGAQLPLPDDTVRVTVRDSSGVRFLFGQVTAATPDSLMLQVADTNVGIDRHQVMRVERRRRSSVRRAMLTGCLAFGGVLALAGSQAKDPDSPGIEAYIAGLGFVFGCGLGALGGATIHEFRTHHAWEEIKV